MTMDCIFRHLLVRTIFDFFRNLSYSSSFVRSNDTCQPSLPLGLSEPWLSMTVTQFPQPGTHLKDIDYCRHGTPYKSSSFGDALMQSSQHDNLARLKLDQILMLGCFISSVHTF
ncbi:hypothetical protein AMECASPLE_025689 [Ameca splendens]|uniref:Uncharacterized protein n=1 Tax=Ameca splendens TaxID=208324 RepID=A0ABV0ZDL4_9TELE